jgi:hypothetical protein
MHTIYAINKQSSLRLDFFQREAILCAAQVSTQTEEREKLSLTIFLSFGTLKNTKQKAQAIKPGLFAYLFNSAANATTKTLKKENLISLFLSDFVAALKSFFGAFDAAASL